MAFHTKMCTLLWWVVGASHWFNEDVTEEGT